MARARGGVSVYFETPHEAEAALLAANGSPDVARVSGSTMLRAAAAIKRALDRWQERYGDFHDDAELDEQQERRDA